MAVVPGLVRGLILIVQSAALARYAFAMQIGGEVVGNMWRTLNK